MPVTINDIELRSEQVRQILKKPPPSLVRWGSAVIFLALAIAVAISMMVHYPSKIAGGIVLNQHLNGEIKLPQAAVARISAGQLVQIRLDLYPHEQLTGNVKDIARNINADNTISVSISLRQPSIILRNGMTGRAEIITSNQSIAGKMFSLLH